MDEKQLDFIPHEIVEQKEEVKSFKCPKHSHFPQTILIDVLVKKTGKIVQRCLFCEKSKHENKKVKTVEWDNHKKNVTDEYVVKTLSMGKHGLKKELIPKELIEAKRAIIKLKNLTDELEKPLMTCRYHGDLFEGQTVRRGKNAAGEPTYRCKQCLSESHRKHYELHKAKVKLKHKEYRESHRQKVRRINTESRKRKVLEAILNGKSYETILHIKNKRSLKRNRPPDDKRVREITDNYVKNNITKRFNIRREDIPESMIQAKRALIQLSRMVRRQREDEFINQLEEKLNGKRHKD